MLRDSSGVTAIEYAFIAAFIAAVSIAAMRMMGGTLNTKLANVASGFDKTA